MLLIRTWPSPRADRAGGHSRCAGVSAGSKGCLRCPATLWFHFNRLSPEPFLPDKGNENKSLSRAQQELSRTEREAAVVFVGVFIASATEGRRFSTLQSLRCYWNFCSSPSPFCPPPSTPNFLRVGDTGCLHSLPAQ